MKRKAPILVKKIRNYKDGFFVEKYSNGSDTKDPSLTSAGSYGDAGNAVGQFGASAFNMTQPANGDTNEWASAGSGALSGAGMGFKTAGLLGAGIGFVGGAAYGLFEGHKKHEQYEKQQLQNTSNNYFANRGNMQTQNIDPYGMQMAYGDFVGDTDGGPGGIKAPTINRGTIGFPKPNDPYWKLHPLWTEHADGTYRQWGEKPNILDTRTLQQKLGNNVLTEPQSSTIPTPIVNGTGDGANPAMTQQRKGPVVQSVPSTSGYYANGASIGLTGQATGKFHVPNAGLRRFAPHMQRVGKPQPLPSNTIDFNHQPDSTTNINAPKFDTGGTTPVNSQQNMINIQKGELLIDPNKGKILQEYNGINPLTGGLFEPHAKNQSEESPNNFTLADPGLFVITKKTAKQYKEAIDNNDKISQKTVLMNIRNAKIAKEGGLQPQGGIQQLPDDSQLQQGNYADGDNVLPNGYTLSPNEIKSLGQSANPSDSPFSDSITMPTNAYRGMDGSFGYKPQSGTNSTGNLGDTLANYGPALYNIGQGLFGHTNHQAYATPINNPYASNVIANMPKNVNMQSTINDIYSNEDLANKNLQGQSNSSAVYRANREGLATGTSKALASTRMQEAELNNQANGQRAYMYNALGYQNQQEQQQVRQYNLGVDDINARRENAKQNLLNVGLSQLQETSQNSKLNNAKAGMDKYTLKLLGQMFPNTKYYSQFQIDYANKARQEKYGY